jgi:hypothetical protein
VDCAFTGRIHSGNGLRETGAAKEGMVSKQKTMTRLVCRSNFINAKKSMEKRGGYLPNPDNLILVSLRLVSSGKSLSIIHW